MLRLDGGAALYLSDLARKRNSPDLLFNGACESEDYFEAATAGDSMSLIADLGEGVAIEQTTAARAFNVRNVASFPDYSKFARNVKVLAGHTYAVLLNDRERRGLFVFVVDKHSPNKEVSIRYAVRSYSIFTSGAVHAGDFKWDAASL